MDKNKCKILISRDAICQHLGVGKKVFYDLISDGLPARQLKSGRWVAHIDVIDGWFVDFTGEPIKKKKKSMLSPDEGGTPRNTRR
jgi:hypothetical protein